MLNRSDQDALCASLARRSEKLARIYRGGLIVLADDKNPCRYELAAHCLRELIEKSPTLISGQAFVTGDGMKNRLSPVRKAYSVVVRSPKFGAVTSFDAVEGLLRGLLSELAKFFEWQDQNRPEAAKRTAQNLSALSGSGPLLPSDYFEAEVAGWMQADEYFKNVAHNRYDEVDRDEFLSHMNFIETTLLRRLQPRSVAQLSELDALIREAENGH
ncbi:MAG TPA: hypothetical protein VGX94_09520 [Terriglobia bacterium]|nr:hypothetical protein [Terriglobia bacterium]